VIGSLVTEPVPDEELGRAKAMLTTAWWRSILAATGQPERFT